MAHAKFLTNPMSFEGVTSVAKINGPGRQSQLWARAVETLE